MTDTIFTRQATLEDLPTLLAFEQGIVKAERPFDVTLDKDPISYYDLKSMLTDDGVIIVVAQSGDRVIGSGYAKIETSKPYLAHRYHAYLGFMFTDPAYRGQGVNAMILSALKDWSRERNVTELRLEVYDQNVPAIKAYEKAGFEKNLVLMRMKIGD